MVELTPDERIRYDRHLLLEEFGQEGQQRLKASSVLVIGAGGLGAPVLQYLAAAGVGRLGIIDPDRVDVSNLQRQILYTSADIGRLKVEVAREYVHRLNEYVKVEVYPEYLSEHNALELFAQYDLIVEGSDSFTAKYMTNDAAVLTDKPFVLGSIFKFEGQLGVFNYQGSATYRCLFPEPMNSAEMPTCREVGVIGVLPGVIGSMMAMEAIKVLTGIGKPLAGRFMTMNLLTQESFTFTVERDPSIQVTELVPVHIFCSTATYQDVTTDEYRQESDRYLPVDVRSEQEHQAFNLGGLHIPLEELADRLDELPTDRDLLIYCNMGVKSLKAIALLDQSGHHWRLFNLKSGCKALQ